MNKKARVGPYVLIATLLLLAIAVPVLAKSPDSSECRISWRALNPDETVWTVYIIGNQVSSWSGTTLTTTCTADIPLGEPLGSATYFDLDDMRDYLEVNFGLYDLPTPLVVGSADGLPQNTYINYKGIEYTADSWSYRVLNSGKCTVTSVYTIP